MLPYLFCSTSFEHSRDRFKEYFKIKPKRPIVNILHIKLHPLVKGTMVAAIDLPKTRHTWTYTETAAVPVLMEVIIVPNREGSRTDEAHVPQQDIEELRQFINAGFSQKLSERGYSRVILDLEGRTFDLVKRF